MYITVILYMVGFLRTLAVIALIYFAIRIFSRYILPLIVQKGVNNMKQKMEDQYKGQQRSGRREGDVTIENNRSSRKNTGSNEGEYIDFEEVE